MKNDVKYTIYAEYERKWMKIEGNHYYDTTIAELHFEEAEDISDEPYEPDEPQIPTDAEVIDEGSCGNTSTYKLYDDGTLVISGTGNTMKFSSLSSASLWRKYREDIKTVIIEDGITQIGAYTKGDIMNTTLYRLSILRKAGYYENTKDYKGTASAFRTFPYANSLRKG